jgi:hypothetical protein
MRVHPFLASVLAGLAMVVIALAYSAVAPRFTMRIPWSFIFMQHVARQREPPSADRNRVFH